MLIKFIKIQLIFSLLVISGCVANPNYQVKFAASDYDQLYQLQAKAAERRDRDSEARVRS